MGRRREFARMLSISEGYWGFIHVRRFFRFLYAALTFFAIFALVAAFFKVGYGTRFASDYLQQKLKLNDGQVEENERMLMYIYLFYPTPLIFAWMVVYFGKFLFCYRVKRLRRARNYKYNLLLATIMAAILYAFTFSYVLSMKIIDGPKLRVALIILICEASLIAIEVFDEQEVRRARHRRKRLLRKQLETEQAIRQQLRLTAMINGTDPGAADVVDTDLAVDDINDVYAVELEETALEDQSEVTVPSPVPGVLV